MKLKALILGMILLAVPCASAQNDEIELPPESDWTCAQLASCPVIRGMPSGDDVDAQAMCVAIREIGVIRDPPTVWIAPWPPVSVDCIKRHLQPFLEGLQLDKLDEECDAQLGKDCPISILWHPVAETSAAATGFPEPVFRGLPSGDREIYGESCGATVPNIAVSTNPPDVRVDPWPPVQVDCIERLVEMALDWLQLLEKLDDECDAQLGKDCPIEIVWNPI